MSSQRSLGQRWLRLLVVAFLCALPFLGAAWYLQNHARQVDTLPLDDYSGLRWMPGRKELAFLHLPLRQTPPPKTEIWKVSSAGDKFDQIGELEAGHTWKLTKMHSGQWLLLESEEGKWMLCKGSEKTVKPMVVDSELKMLPTQGDGFFFESLEQDLPFDQFVDVEAAPDMKPELEELPREPEPYPEEAPEGEELEAPPKPPTHLGLQISEFDPETDEVKALFSIPYNNPQEKPLVELVRRSPDKRFVALIVKFGESGSPGLWVFDSENERLLWTRLVVSGKAHGMDWSSDSVTVAVSDSQGLAILEQALNIESTRLEMATTPDLVPMFGAGKKLYLASSTAIYKVEQERGRAEPIFDATVGDDLVFDPLGDRVAYSESPQGFRELVVKDLKSSQQLARATYPGSVKQKAQGQLTYQVGSAIRRAVEAWF